MPDIARRISAWPLSWWCRLSLLMGSLCYLTAQCSLLGRVVRYLCLCCLLVRKDQRDVRPRHQEGIGSEPRTSGGLISNDFNVLSRSARWLVNLSPAYMGRTIGSISDQRMWSHASRFSRLSKKDLFGSPTDTNPMTRPDCRTLCDRSWGKDF